MVDTVIGTATDGNDFSAGLDNGFTWTGETTGYYFFVEVTSGNLVYRKTTDAATLAAAVDVNTNVIKRFAVWPDSSTPGDSGKIIHILTITGGNALAEYQSLDTSDDSISTAITLTSTSTLDSNSDWRTIGGSITKAIGGNILIAEVARNDTLNLFRRGFWRSIDGGASFAQRADVYENTGDAANTDRVILMYGNEADNQDIYGFYFDDSAVEVSLKTYDDSADSWSAGTSITTAVSFPAGDRQLGYSVVPRHSDNHMILAVNEGRNSVTHDIHVFDCNGEGSITAKIDVFTNEDDHEGEVALFIDQNSDDIYALYGGATGEDPIVTGIHVYYKVSTDGADSWGAETQFDADAVSIHSDFHTGVSVGSSGGRFQPCWTQDLGGASPDEYKTNFDNSIAISGSSPVAISAQVAMQQRELLLI